jgi:DNA-binding response OmpR family regulator
MSKILVVEDEHNMRDSLIKYLQSHLIGCQCRAAESLNVASEAMENDQFDLILLDWNLPDGEGIDWLRDLRSQGIVTPVILLTGRKDLIDKVVGLEVGANDYVVKPYEMREILARIRVQLRGASAEAPTQEHKVDNIVMNTESRQVTVGGNLVELKKLEFDLLEVLIEKPNKVFSRDEILTLVWGYDIGNHPTTRTIDNHILSLRKKLDSTSIETVRGVGYRYKTGD